MGDKNLDSVHLTTVNSTIDRLSVTGYPNASLEAILGQYHDVIASKYRGKFPACFVYKTITGANISELARNVDPDCSQARYRVDFNPNSIVPREAELLSEVIRCYKPDTARLSRVDIAFDYKGHNVGDYQMAYVGPRSRETRRFFGRSGKLETFYAGAPDSDNQLKVYDKAVEQRSEGDWWRVEVQLRNLSKWKGGNPFTGLLLYRTKMGVEDWVTRARVEYYLRHPEARKYIPRSEQKKLKKLAAMEAETLQPSPEDVYNENYAQLIDAVYCWTGMDMDSHNTLSSSCNQLSA